ncbi:nuclear transport factor 2 family protein [Actinopolymorpha alba]|uniref:nuclear transport factor 2 family protein n=1 Tax=Actinopolymorpha alba TaxID=533267 RepID=UPI00037F3321|nr:nuclear transport factor 2 family protein [Actinopolymorpha alba]
MPQSADTTLTPREAFARFQEAVLEGTTEDLPGLAADVVVEWPFNPPGRPRRIQGRDAFRALARRGQEALPLRFEEFRNVVIHEVGAEPDSIVVEYDLAATNTATGHNAAASFALILSVHDGQITHLREYQNVLAMAEALGHLPALLDSLGRPTAAHSVPHEKPTRDQVLPAGNQVLPAGNQVPPADHGPRAVFARYQNAVLQNSAGRMAVADLFAVDGVMEFPFTALGMPERVEGREAIRAWLRPNLGVGFRFEEYRNVVIHDTANPEVITVEHDIAGSILATGQPHQISYLYVIHVREGEIVLLRDYADLVDVMAALGGPSALAARVAGQAPNGKPTADLSP